MRIRYRVGHQFPQDTEVFERRQKVGSRRSNFHNLHKYRAMVVGSSTPI